jgi:hypothetical protein
MGVSGQRHVPAALYPGTHWIGGWVGPRAGLDEGARRKILCPCRGSNLNHPIVQPVVRHYTTWATAASTGLQCFLELLFHENHAFRICVLTYSIENNPSWEANSSVASQIPSLLWTLKLLKWARNWSLSWATLIQSPHSHPISLRSILIFSNLPLCLFKLSVVFKFPDQNFVRISHISSMHATYIASLNLLDLIILTVFGSDFPFIFYGSSRHSSRAPCYSYTSLFLATP